jgi:hypothetical protein
MALKADLVSRTWQEFLSHLKWNEGGMRDELQQIVASDLWPILKCRLCLP